MAFLERKKATKRALRASSSRRKSRSEPAAVADEDSRTGEGKIDGAAAGERASEGIWPAPAACSETLPTAHTKAGCSLIRCQTALRDGLSPPSDSACCQISKIAFRLLCPRPARSGAVKYETASSTSSGGNCGPGGAKEGCAGGGACGGGRTDGTAAADGSVRGAADDVTVDANAGSSSGGAATGAGSTAAAAAGGGGGGAASASESAGAAAASGAGGAATMSCGGSAAAA